MPDVVHGSPPLKKVAFMGKDGRERKFNVRKKDKPKLPPVPTGETVRCPYCDNSHDVMLVGQSRTKKTCRRIRTWYCPAIKGSPLIWSDKGQQYIEDHWLVKKPTPKRGEAAPKEEKAADEDEDIGEFLRQVRDIEEGLK